MIRLRWEVLLIHWLPLFGITSLEIFFRTNIQLLEEKDIWFLTLLNLCMAFFFSLILEFIYILTKIVSIVLLRLKLVWKYAVPSILVFFLFVFPLFDLTELKLSFHQLEGLRGSIFISIYGIIILISILLIFIFPLFYDLNGGFIIVSSILSYVILKTILFSYYNTYSVYYFLILYYIFIFLFYFFLQLRRRFSINVIYEKYSYPIWFVALCLILLLLFLYLKFINSTFPYIILYTILSYLTLINIIFSILINIETKYNKNILIVPKSILIILLIFNLFLGFFLFYNLKKFNFTYVYKTKNLVVIYLLEILHCLNDKDLDGENSIIANDPDNTNTYIRSEGRFQLEDEMPYINKFPENNFDYYFITLNFNKENQNLENSFLSPSNDISISLFSLLNQLSSYESYSALSNELNKKYKSIFTNLTENYYRTICIGYDNNQNYFSIKSKTRLDRGCEIFLPFSDMDSNNTLQNDNPIEHFKTFLNYSKKQFLAYKTKNNSFWLHYDFSDKKVKEDFLKEFINHQISSILQPFKINIIITMLFYAQPIPSYQVYTNQMHIHSILDPDLPYYSTLFRIIYFNEFEKAENFNSKTFEEKVHYFQKQFEFKKIKSIHQYVFIEPQDHYWKELTKIFKNPILPPISITKTSKNEYKIYDGRFGYESINFNSQQ